MRSWFLLLLVYSLVPTAWAESRLTILDVGEGQAVLLQVGKAGFLIDTGPLHYSPKMIPQLHSQGVKSIEGLILTHLHPDHASGFFRLLEAYPKMKIYRNCSRASPREESPVMRWLFEAVKSKPCLKRGDQQQWRGFKIHTLWPPAGSKGNANQLSLVLAIHKYGKRALLMGDVDQGVEAKLLKLISPAPLDLYIAGHHGARDTASEAWIKQVRPKITAISVNKDNHWGYPDPKAIGRLQQYSGGLLQTKTRGAICFYWPKKAPLRLCQNPGPMP